MINRREETVANGVGMEPPVFLQAGDVVRCEIDGIGAIENKVGENKVKE